jgi:NAD(P)H-hydrate repair Nnr-like enzyme with NAD(P)H-hydrate dehydratase domain
MGAVLAAKAAIKTGCGLVTAFCLNVVIIFFK